MTFRLAPGAGARGLQAMVPAAGGTGPLLSLTRDGQPVGAETRTVKGITYKVFDAAAGPTWRSYPPGPDAPPATGSSAALVGSSATDKAAKVNPATVQVLPRSVTAPTSRASRAAGRACGREAGAPSR